MAALSFNSIITPKSERTKKILRHVYAVENATGPTEGQGQGQGAC